MRTLFILFVMIFRISSINAQEPLIKFNLQNGEARTYNISEIEEINFIKSGTPFFLIIHRNDHNIKPVFSTKEIESITFSDNQTHILILIDRKSFEYALSKIDSITINETDMGNYETVELCNQIWMRKNLDVTTYRNGESIRHCETAAEWQDANSKKEGAWCYYNNDESNGNTYGKLYNWYAVNDPRGLAPEGWHIPTDEEWKILEKCLGMSHAQADYIGYRGTDQGSQLAGRADLWNDGNLETNANFGTSGFSALPGGLRGSSGAFGGIGGLAYWWSSSEDDATYAWTRHLYYGFSKVLRLSSYKESGFSVRCVRD
jgi:uncharacterized protein (TIGR02145 family)